VESIVSGHFWRTQNSSAACISSSPSHLPHSKYDTQMTQILLEEYIFIVRPWTILIFRIWIRWNFFFKSSSDRPKVAKLSSQTLRVIR